MSEVDEAIAELEALKKLDDLTGLDRARLMAQGAAMGWSDEFIAMLKSMQPSVTYDEAVAEERELLKSAQEKPGSFKYELAGSVAPGIFAAPFTGGTSLLPTLGRVVIGNTGKTVAKLAGTGAAQGTIASLGTQDDISLGNTLLAASTSAAANPLISKTLSFFGNGLKKLTVDPIIQKLQGSSGKTVEDELTRIIIDSGLKIDDVVQRVRGGEIIPEMSSGANETVRLIVNKMTPASPIIEKALQNRKGQFIGDVFNSLQKDLAPTVKGKATEKGTNVFQTFVNATNKLKQQKWETYQEIWKSEGGKYVSNVTPDVKTYQEIGDGVINLVGVSKGNGKIINDFFDVKGLPPILKETDEGWELIRQPTLYEGEKVKQAFMNASKRLESGPATKEQYSRLEKQIKDVLDNVSEPLRNVRRNWREIEGSIKQYDVGRKLLSPRNDPQEFRIYWDKLTANGSKVEIDALRMGVAQNLKKRLGESIARRSSVINKLADDPLNMDQNERQLLEIIYQGMPKDKLEKLLKSVNLASGSIKAVAKISGGSQTGREVGGGQTVGKVVNFTSKLYRALLMGDLEAGRSLVTSFGGNANKISDEAMVKVARLLVSNDANLIQRALTDGIARDQLINKINRYLLIEGIDAGLSRATSYATEKGTSSLIDVPDYEDAIIPIIREMNKSTKQKVINSTK
tara:strand:+ start:1062 stop:3116 length:2055 start_codon:yes stop_codon:yes gene_type:complete